MPEFGVAVEKLTSEAAAIRPMGGEVKKAGQLMIPTRDAAKDTLAGPACDEFAVRATTMLDLCGPALDHVASALTLAAVCYQRAEQAAGG